MPNQSLPAETLSHRVRRTLEDLLIIRQTLQSPSLEVKNTLALDLELAAELKSVVDALRQLLWAYIQALSAHSGRKPQEILEWYKMEIAVEMLRSVRSRRSPAASHVEETSGFEQLVSGAMTITSLYAGKEPRC